MPLFPPGQLYINGELRSARDGKLYDDISPWTGEVIAQAADASAADVDAAIAAARHAFDKTNWSVDQNLRLETVKRYRDLLHANEQRLLELARNEAGAAIGAGHLAHVGGALAGADTLIDCFAEVQWREPRGRRIEYGSTTERVLLREPIGVVGAIIPWNVPIYITVGKVIAALLAGCTVVLKAAPDTPLCGAIFGELADQTGLPKGVLNVITSSDPAMAGEMLVTDPRVDLISFTGSAAVGRRIMAKGGPTLKRIFLELGGKSAGIILEDAPAFAETVKGMINVFHAGQGCANITRLLVPRSRHGEAIAALSEAYDAFDAHWGDFDNPNQIMGPVISKQQFDRVMGYIELGQKEGARLLAGGKPRPDRGKGFFIEPTCFIDASNDMRIAREEIFGPVLTVIAFEDDDDAVDIANDSEYGLCGAIFTGDAARGQAIAQRIRTGTISVNGGSPISPDVPFGGYKSSGIGREWGREGIEGFCEMKLIGTRVAA
jgi:aldehyde dehydrogenase (NAD+)